MPKVNGRWRSQPIGKGAGRRSGSIVDLLIRNHRKKLNLVLPDEPEGIE
jgi:hypothetical protein